MMNDIAKNIEEKLSPAQLELRENLTDGKRNKSYWERRWKEDPESVCRDLENLYRTTGSEYQALIVDLIDKKFTHFEAVFTDNSKRMLSMIEDLRNRRREDRDIIDRHESEISTLKHCVTNNSIQLEQSRKIIDLIHDGQKVANSNIEFIRDHIAAPFTLAQKEPSLSKIPAIAWPVIGVVSIAAIAAASGQMAAFIGWLGAVNVFGG
jgi:hypothetical protein